MPRKKQYQWTEGDIQETGAPSRSQRKRESTALQDMGEKLTKLPAAALDPLPLTPAVREAVDAWHTMTSREARRRQLQFIGRLMREESEPSAIQAALDALCEREADERFRFRHLEERREALIAASPDVRENLCASYGIPEEHIAEMMKLAAEARNERDNNRPPRAFRALFRLLRDIAAAQPGGSSAAS